MRKQSRRVLFSGLSGVIVGGFLIVSALSYIGAKSGKQDVERVSFNESSGENIVTTEETNIPTISPTPSPSENKDDKSSLFERGKFKYVLPGKYRVASEIIALDQKNSGGTAILTLTQGSLEKEKEYVQLIDKLQQDRVGTEAPQFLPGKTITIYPSDIMSESSDAKIAGAKKEVSTKSGLKGIRYFKVEGLFPYDITYLNFADGRKIAIQMNYASEEPFFDESAYAAIIDSIKPGN